MISLFWAAIFALFIGTFSLLVYGETGNMWQLFIGIINYTLGVIDLIVFGINF